MAISAGGPALLTRRNAALGMVAALLLAAAGGGKAGAADAAPETFVQQLGDQSIAILADKSLNDQQKATKLKQLLNQSTNLEYVARVILGRHWPQASAAQRQEYVRLFDALVLEAMAERINSYAGQSFKVTGTQAGGQDMMVKTIIAQPAGGPQYHVDWRVRKGTAGNYQLIDIVAEGVSLVLTQRSEVDGIVNQSGIDGLLAEMRRRLQQRNVTAPKTSG